MTDELHAVLLDAIRADPDDGARWLDLASWLWVQGRDDEAIAVRVFWPTLRDNLAHVSLEATLAGVARNAKRLGRFARETDRRENETPPPV
jgi:hypothetical protein